MNERRKHWDYRVVHHKCEEPGRTGQIAEWYAVHECFYGLDGKAEGSEEASMAWSIHAVELEADDVEALRKTLQNVTADIGPRNRRAVIECPDCSFEKCYRMVVGPVDEEV